MRITTEQRSSIKAKLQPKFAKAAGHDITDYGVNAWDSVIDGIIDAVEEIIEVKRPA